VHRSFIRRAHLFPDGGLLVVFEYIGLVRLDRDSMILWSVANQAHHDLFVTADGTIVTLTRNPRTKASLSRDHPGVGFAGDVQDDRVTVLDPRGTEIRSVSLLDAFLRSDFAPHLAVVREAGGDILHTNSVDLVGPDVAARHPFAAEGDVLVSIRNLDTLAILDAQTGLIRWVTAGQWRRQHQAQFLSNGNLLLFDNRGGPADPATGSESSRILEVDPVTQAIRWRYGGRAPFYSKALGSVRRLGNGNTLITESHQGRILEVAPDGKIVWEYWNPHRAGENDELIATIMGAQRIDPATLEFL
jgi:outer membrane protein assembly factor BamB